VIRRVKTHRPAPDAWKSGLKVPKAGVALLQFGAAFNLTYAWSTRHRRASWFWITGSILR
jgi:hypothetical protein